ncbi:response regulator [Bacillus thuringiensis]|uniref:response regulator n=2 Tax=Bacillus thuringiensis TaxID=1428 RepID=UPI0007C49941|nr:response regulator [Bacillus thuringiensis]MEC3225449.1 response regulator [Bacillus thuringiensis]MEC3464324.1 response regulator [Bacillus thuringiensis]MEC3556516.1 response regulator [Bacillus thuringiensis]MEC3597900.1 response regulator [Bacillus thuringiensis]MED1837304.1 response regulator [Bacillus thuringiensis]
MIKVIIAEDDPMVAMINQQFIEKFVGFRIIASVGNVEELWDVINKHVPDLILLDVYLPGDTGIEFLQAIRQKQLSIPVIMITAAHDKLTIKKSLEHGVIDFLIKPFSFERFELAIENFLRFHSLTTKLQKFDQDTLDQILIKERSPAILNTTCKEVYSRLPKGLSKLTCKKIIHVVLEQEGYFSTEDIAKKVNLSRISTKKYLLYLNNIGYLNEELKYLAVGRPIMVFHIVPEKEHLIMSFK